MEKVIRGKRKQIELVITCLLAGGHILMEDNPGTGKTTTVVNLLACLVARDVDCRIALAAPTGMTMNSWKSTFVSACAPPFRMFIIGTGNVRAIGPPR